MDDLLGEGMARARAGAFKKWCRLGNVRPDWQDARQRGFERMCKVAHLRHTVTKRQWMAIACWCGQVGALDEARDMDPLSHHSRRVVKRIEALSEQQDRTPEQELELRSLVAKHQDKLSESCKPVARLHSLHGGAPWEENPVFSDHTTEDAVIGAIDARDMSERLLSAVNRLPKCQRIDFMSYLETGSLKTTASLRGKTEAAACINVGKARKTLRARLAMFA